MDVAKQILSLLSDNSLPDRLRAVAARSCFAAEEVAEAISNIRPSLSNDIDNKNVDLLVNLLSNLNEDNIHQLRHFILAQANDEVIKKATCMQPSAENEACTEISCPHFINQLANSEHSIDFFVDGPVNVEFATRESMLFSSINEHTQIQFTIEHSIDKSSELFTDVITAMLKWDSMLLDRVAVMHRDLNVPVATKRTLIQRGGTVSFNNTPLAEASQFVLYTDEELLEALTDLTSNCSLWRLSDTAHNGNLQPQRMMNLELQCDSMEILRLFFSDMHPYNTLHVGSHDALANLPHMFGHTRLVPSLSQSLGPKVQENVCESAIVRSQTPSSRNAPTRTPANRTTPTLTRSKVTLKHTIKDKLRAAKQPVNWPGESLWLVDDGTMIQTPAHTGSLRQHWENHNDDKGIVKCSKQTKLRSHEYPIISESDEFSGKFLSLPEVSCSCRSIFRDVCDKATHAWQNASHYSVIQKLCRQGVSEMSRATMWSTVLGAADSDHSSLNSISKRYTQDYYFKLLDAVHETDMLVDDLIRADVVACCDEDRWFPFEKFVMNILMAWSRDIEVYENTVIRPHGLIKAANRRESSTDTSNLPIPLCGVLPYEQLTLLAIPLAFVTNNEACAYALWKKMYSRFWCRLSTLSSSREGLMHLCRQFESILIEYVIYYHNLNASKLVFCRCSGHLRVYLRN